MTTYEVVESDYREAELRVMSLTSKLSYPERERQELVIFQVRGDKTGKVYPCGDSNPPEGVLGFSSKKEASAAAEAMFGLDWCSDYTIIKTGVILTPLRLDE